MILRDVPLNEVLVDEEFNCRKRIERADVLELMADIKSRGLIQPVLVQEFTKPKDGKRYKLIAGFRRFKAFEALRIDEYEKYSTIPATVRVGELTLIEAQYLNIAENLVRTDLSPTEEATVVARLAKSGETEAVIAAKLGKSQSWVNTAKLLHGLPEPVKEMVDAGYIKKVNIRELATLKRATSEEACIRAAAALKAGYLAGKKNQKLSLTKHDPNRRRVRSKRDIEALQDHLLDTVGPNLATQVLGWAAAHLSDKELFERIETYAQENGIEYDNPSHLASIDEVDFEK